MAEEKKPVPQIDTSQIMQDLAKGTPAAAMAMVVGWMLITRMDTLEDGLRQVQEQLSDIRIEAVERTADRWTGEKQQDYAAKVEGRLRNLEDRVTRIETSR